MLAWFSSLFGCLTHYGCGPAPIFFGMGCLTQKEWWKAGFLLSLFHLAVWGGLGCLWGKVMRVW